MAKLSDDPKMNKLILKHLQAAKKTRPDSSSSWRLANSVFKAQNDLTKGRR